MKNHWMAFLSVTCLAGVACTASLSVPPDGRQGFTWVSIHVWGNDSTLVGAVLTDRQGRRTGWEAGRAFHEIPQCAYYTDADECCPDDAPIVGNSGELIYPEAAADSSPPQDSSSTAGSEGPPLDNEFDVQLPSSGHGLVADGRCDLWVTPSHAGVVTIRVVARRGAPRGCAPAVTARMLQFGWRYLYRIEWKPEGDSCGVRITPSMREKLKPRTTK